MKALAYDRFGPPNVLRLAELPEPRPRRGEVLVAVHAAALNPKDVLVRKGKFCLLSGRGFPRVPGYDVAGVVVDSRAKRISPGDEVFGMINAWKAGACAERVAVPAAELASKPAGLTMTEAAALPLVGLTALQALRELLAVGRGDRVLINGASGGVGTVAVQIARALGATVVATCSERNVERVRELGAHDVVDYALDDALGRDRRYDAVFDVFGNRSFDEARGALGDHGVYVTTVPGLAAIAREAVARVSRRGRSRLVLVRSSTADLEVLSRWIAEGSLRPVIDRVVRLEQGAEAQRYLETRRARGKVVIEI